MHFDNLFLQLYLIRESRTENSYYSDVYLGTARRIRGDNGTENLNIAGIQRYFRRHGSDSFVGVKSFQFGKSTANQVVLLKKIRF